MRIFDRNRVESYCGPTTVYHIVSRVLPWVFFLGTVIALAAAWGRIPEKIPMQTDFHGNVTGWGDRTSLIWLAVVYLIINLTLLIVEFFPQSWNNGVRINAFGLKKDSGVRSYRLTRDMLCDLRIGMSALFAAAMLWSAFGNGGNLGGAIGIAAVPVVLIPMIRFLVRMYLFR